MTRYFILAVLVTIAGYGLTRAWPLIIGPSLFVATPENGTSFPGGIVAVGGRASRVAELTLDGSILLHDEQGNFSSTLTFPRGGSILTFVATDRFGRRATVTRAIFVP